jgi:hypothetical protein
LRRSLYLNGFVSFQPLNSVELSYEDTNNEYSKELNIYHKSLSAFKIDSLEDWYVRLIKYP